MKDLAHTKKNKTRDMNLPDGVRCSSDSCSLVGSLFLLFVFTFLFYGLKAYCFSKFDLQIYTVSNEELELAGACWCSPLRYDEYNLLLNAYIFTKENFSCRVLDHYKRHFSSYSEVSSPAIDF